LNFFKEIDTTFEVCTCGHMGGKSPNSSHASHFQAGHGQCLSLGCECGQFTWKGWANSKGEVLE